MQRDNTSTLFENSPIAIVSPPSCSAATILMIVQVGVAAELPGGAAGNLDFSSFHDYLLNKGEAYEKIPLERFRINKLAHILIVLNSAHVVICSIKGRGLGQVVTDTGSFLKDIDSFDYRPGVIP